MLFRSGRKLGLYIAEGADAGMVSALMEAVKSEGGMVEVVAPHVTGAKLSDGKLQAADQKIDGAPSVLYDAVAVVMGEKAGKNYADDKPSIDFVNDAFAHAKFIGYAPGAMPLLKGAGVAGKMDQGFVELADANGAAAKFIDQCKQLRFWDRAAVKQD